MTLFNFKVSLMKRLRILLLGSVGCGKVGSVIMLIIIQFDEKLN